MNFNLDDSGFFVRIPKEAVERATYRVSICVKKGYIEALRYSDIKIDFRPWVLRKAKGLWICTFLYYVVRKWCTR